MRRAAALTELAARALCLRHKSAAVCNTEDFVANTALHQAVLSHLIAQSIASDAKLARRLRLVAGSFRQSVGQEPPLVALESLVPLRGSNGRRSPAPRGKAKVLRQVLYIDRFGYRHNAGMSEHVLQFANVARPVVTR